MNKQDIENALTKALEGKGKRKFAQSVDVIFNFKGIDTAKPENRLNLDVSLPKGRGKDVPVVVFGEQAVALEGNKAGAKVVDTAGIPKMAQDKKGTKKLAKEAEFIAAPNMMVLVGKNLGQMLGAHNRMPRPIVGNVAEAIQMAKNRVRLASRGKYLPTVQCAIGVESMSVPDLEENFEAVHEKVKGKVGEACIDKVYVKLSMGPAVRVGGSGANSQ